MEPADKNFKRFEKDNPFIHLNMYTPAADDEKCTITPLYIGMNHSSKIVNILYYKNKQTSHYAYIWNISCLIMLQQSVITRRSMCAHTVPAPTSIRRRLSNHIDKKHPYIENEFVCEKCLNVFHTRGKGVP